MSVKGMRDPLTVNLNRQTRYLLSKISHESPFAQALQNVASLPELLTLLSHLLAVPSLTLLVAEAFRPILFDLCARWLHDDQNLDQKFIALCLLLEPHQELFSILSAFLRKTYSGKGPLAFILDTQSAGSLDSQHLHHLLLAYYRILQANRALPKTLLWPLLPLVRLIRTPHPDSGVRFLAIRCYCLQIGAGEQERVKMEKEVIGEVSEADCPITYGVNLDGTISYLDGWILPILETKRISDARVSITENGIDYYFVEDGEVVSSIPADVLSPYTANIHGVFLLKQNPATERPSTLVMTDGVTQSLRQLAIHLSLRFPVLLTSTPSSGKSLLLSHLAGVLHPLATNQIITIHLADTSLDPRSLLGSYTSSPTQPGSFEWKEGVLVRAMKQGKWVVLQDIDRGSNEVLGVLKPLIESLGPQHWVGACAALDVPSQGRVVASENFAIFATRSTTPNRDGSYPKATFFGSHKFYEVINPPPTREELQIIINSRFPSLAGAPALAIIRLWESVRNLEGTAPASARVIGARELEKFCARLQRFIPRSTQAMEVDADNSATQLSAMVTNPALREEIYLEARDVLFGSGILTTAARLHTERVALTVGDNLDLSPERQSWILQSRVPELDIEKDVNGRTIALRVGRNRLPATPTRDIIAPNSRPFAMHKPAISLISRLANSVTFNEPVLLTGETGTGKTTVITHMASVLRKPLVSVNLSQQTESSDLLGGFKPVDARIPGSELQSRFTQLFGATFSRKKNAKFEESIRKAVLEWKWKRAVALWLEAVRLAKDRYQAKSRETEPIDEPRESARDTARKRRKLDQDDGANVTESSWIAFEQDVRIFDIQHVQEKGRFAFSFVEGPLVKALRSGYWILLDEINLASPETLECILGLLQSSTSSITLTEQGSLEPVPRHPDFRIFACMNPATDVGKKDLPPNIRSRFTEIDVPPPDADMDTLLSIVEKYIGHCTAGDKGAVMDVAEFYIAVKQLSEERKLADGSNHRPHYSMRTLARALTWAADMASSYGLRRAVWEGCLMGFTMVLDPSSADAVSALARRHILAGVRNPGSFLARDPATPSPAEQFVKFGPFYLERGPHSNDTVDDYILTPSVEKKLMDLARIITTRRFPVLIEGPTSSGKTSSIEYLARRTGHRFVRINNHEHTDIQEYLGTYVSDPTTGKLTFKDGLLVRALRNGDWIVLDELNLAPTDVLEALNRLLDDNRELVIPETQEVIRPHPHFLLFATQNPPGLYAGRKVLSRAFRNRFLEVHFQDVPQEELETILCQRCRIAPSYAHRIVGVFQELQKRRQHGRVFESKQGFATLRDLFRWAGRDAVGYQELAENGYMLLAERTRRADDKAVVKEVIQTIMNVRIDDRALYNIHSDQVDFATILGSPVPQSPQLVWTDAMKRLYVLVARALRFNEPVLLVGETGSGKTSVCQVYASAVSNYLHMVNCHQNTETADLIGGLRPVRNKASLEAEAIQKAVDLLRQLGVSGTPSEPSHLASALDSLLKSSPHSSSHARSLEDARNKLLSFSAMFEWHDGPLVRAMRQGEVFLMDEISLADDSVLERLNSVLEPARTLVLAERGGDNADVALIQAEEGFRIVATMNPGGDYGKKELSPALRNRFTEIWVPSVEDRTDLEAIVNSLWRHAEMQPYTRPLLDFVEWLSDQASDRSLISLRDILAWVTFSNSMYPSQEQRNLSLDEIFHHAAKMTYLDGLGAFSQFSAYSAEAISRLKKYALEFLKKLAPFEDVTSKIQVRETADDVQLGAFAIRRGPKAPEQHMFNLQAPTTFDNAMRVVRACQVPKPILLEGSPGVGKTSLIAALANISGHHLARINLSDQTDIIDLFGSDLPVEGGAPGEFRWKDAEFLRALQEGHWVLLDEMNLAPQAILEGLNSVLDHRGSVYIPELGRTFIKHPDFRIFAAQNPLHQGGGRKGLPKSFLNRFTKVYVEQLSPFDLLLVCRHLFPHYPVDILRDMITFNTRLNEEVVMKREFAREGAPWEFNLRDVIRWGELLQGKDRIMSPADHLQTIYLQRFRTSTDRDRVLQLFTETFSLPAPPVISNPRPSITPSHIQVGSFFCGRQNHVGDTKVPCLLNTQLQPLESIGACLSHAWLVILTGSHQSGKTSLVRLAAGITGNVLHEVSMNNATDTMDILGSFEQVDSRSRVSTVLRDVCSFVENAARQFPHLSLLENADYDVMRNTAASELSANDLLSLLEASRKALQGMEGLANTFADAQKLLLARIAELTMSLDSTGRFEWVDGPLVRALKQGHWILLDDANLCNPSVLDRLNSLCESDGVLTLSERGHVDGAVQIIKPHPNFKLFMTVDPHRGELSRAMRNRGVEIALFHQRTSEDQQAVFEHHRLPFAQIDLGGAQPSLVQFELRRRGVLTDGQKAIPNWSGSSLITHDCVCKDLADYADSFCLFTSTACVEDALLYFLVHIAAPAHLPYLLRLLRSTSLPQNGSVLPRVESSLLSLPSQQLWSALSQLRRESGDACGVPSDFMSFQPMDIFLSSLPGLIFQSQTNAATHPQVIQSLNLYIDLYIGNEKNHLQLGQSAAQKKVRGMKTNKTITVSRAVGEVQELLDSVLITGKLVLEQISFDADVSPSATHLMSQVLRYSHYLREVVQEPAFDYSAVQVLSRWIMDAVRNAPPMLGNLITCAKRLQDAVSLSSGLGLHDIWSAMLAERQSTIKKEMLTELDILASSSSSLGMRRRIFQLIALQTLPTSLSNEEARLLESLNVQAMELLDVHRSTPIAVQHAHDLSFLPAEINILRTSSGIHSDQKSTAFIEHVIDMVCKDVTQPMLLFLSYQHSIWAAKSDKTRMPIVAMMQKEWLQNLWNSSGDHSGMQGPSLLLRPTSLSATHAKSDWTMVSLAEMSRYRTSVLNHLNLTRSLFEIRLSRMEELTGILMQSILMVLNCFVVTFDDEIIQAIRGFSHRPDIGSTDSIQELSHMIERIPHPYLKAPLALALRSELDKLANASGNASFVQLGHCWVTFSMFLLDLYVPDVPVDPSAIQRCTEDFWQRAEDVWFGQIRLHKRFEKTSTGNSSNEVTEYLEKELVMIQDHLATASVAPRRQRKDIGNLHTYWSEVSQFLAQVVSSSKVDSLLSVSNHGKDSGRLREAVFQESVTGFCQRIEAAYPEFDDINGPLLWSLYHMKFGIRLAVDGATHEELALGPLAEALVKFPSIISADALTAEGALKGGSAVSAFASISLSLHAMAFAVTSGVDLVNLLPSLTIVYDQVIRLWAIDRTSEEEFNKSASSLYRGGSSSADYSDVEQERSEFLELFPDFEGLLEDDVDKPQQATSKPVALVQLDDIRQLSLLHHRLVSGDKNSDSIRRFRNIRQQYLHAILQTHFSELPQSLDGMSLQYRTSILEERIDSLQNTAGDEERPYNFYQDHNVSEVNRATQVLQSLKKRLHELVTEWPDQMVLQHLSDRCNMLLSLHLNSSVAYVLAALEQLLLQSEDWEMYANRQNTLAAHRREIIDLIVRWRRLELSCWNGLLERESRRFAEGAGEWWLHLYEALVRGYEAATDDSKRDETAIDRYLTGLLPILDDFFAKSPMGQFKARVQLVEDFELYIGHQASMKHKSRTSFDRVRRILRNTRQFYSQFATTIALQLSQQRAVLEKEIQGFIKLASWKDINVQALKQSAQRTHHQLYKCIRKFRDVLRQPITSLLATVPASEPEHIRLHYTYQPTSVPSQQPAFPERLSSSRQRPHLSDIGRTFLKFDHIITSELHSYIRDCQPEKVDELAVDIIATANYLAKETVPGTLDKEKRQKSLKALFVRKKKACSDFLKELKRVGIAANVKPEILRDQGDSRWLREQPLLAANPDDIAFYEKGDIYFFRLLSLLPNLKAASTNHSADISTRELQRAMILVESGLSMALSSRTSLAQTFEFRKHLVSTCHRMGMMKSCSGILCSGPALAVQVLFLRDTLWKLSAALDELLGAVPPVEDLHEQMKIDNVRMEISTLAVGIVSRLRTSVSKTYQDLQSTRNPLLLEDERQTLTTATEGIRRVSGHLKRWAKEQPRLFHLCHPLSTWLDNINLPGFEIQQRTSEPVLDDLVDNAIDALLIVIQSILKLSKPSEAEADTESPDNFIKDGVRKVQIITKSLQLEAILGHLEGILQVFVNWPAGEVQDAIGRILPFLERYLVLVDEQLLSHGKWTDALFKLDYVLCSVVQTLAKDGFCKPPEMETEEDGEGGKDVEDGVGLGEGSGKENVSKEIEDESQVEGLQDDGTENDERNKQDEDENAIEMSEDIGGSLEDVEEKEGQEEEQSEGESEADPEEQIGNLDKEDPAAVDEKLWGDESGPQDSKSSDDKTQDDHSTGDQEASDVVAKEGKKKESGEEEKQGKDADKETQEEVEDEEVPAEEQDTEAPNANGAPLDEHIDEANTLDLPEDLNLGEDTEMQGPEDLGPDDDGLPEDEDLVPSEDDDLRDVPEPDFEDNPTAEEEAMDEADDEMQKGQESENAEEKSPEEQQDEKLQTTQPDLHSGDGKGDGLPEASDSGARTEADEGAQGAQGQGGEESSGKSDEQDEQNTDPQQHSNSDLTESDGKDGKGASASQRGKVNTPSATSQLQNNPLRSLGDTLREVRKNLEQILESGDQREETNDLAPNPEAPHQQQLQYIRPDEEDQEMQALGSAGDEQAAKLSDLKLIDEEQPANDLMPMEVDPDPKSEASQRAPASNSHHPEKEEERPGVEGGLTQDDVRPQKGNSWTDLSSLPAQEDILMSEEDVQRDVETRLKEWQAAGQPEHDVENIWRLYESLTHDLSYALCEQLRLILEPTQATRLKGDYRTGKRLNMKKIIPYIASEYTKDKIWLRRTRPSNREYQVLISLDDSRSMSESHSVHLAFQTLALVSKALGRLEVGDIAIAKFGQTVDVLHGFNGGPFTDHAGMSIINSFKFDQKATNVLSLIETSLKLLEEARERGAGGSSTAADLWQLQIIISDGMCQDQERLRTVLRRAEEQRVMIVFVILDSLHSHIQGASTAATPSNTHDPIKNSILSMQRGVQFVNANGVLDIRMEGYLDSFPFEYYVVLRDVEALPDILSGTLKQFFERISEE